MVVSEWMSCYCHRQNLAKPSLTIGWSISSIGCGGCSGLEASWILWRIWSTRATATPTSNNNNVVVRVVVLRCYDCISQTERKHQWLEQVLLLVLIATDHSCLEASWILWRIWITRAAATPTSNNNNVVVQVVVLWLYPSRVLCVRSRWC